VARQRFPGAPASLDALCRRFEIDLSVREKHGADIDCGLLASVYLELLGGRQPALALVADAADAALDQEQAALRRKPRPPRPHLPTDEELKAHRAMLEGIKSPLWLAKASG
jgi:DNA polymerase-3 subunit epsilon